jgi:hypothetical protein
MRPIAAACVVMACAATPSPVSPPPHDALASVAWLRGRWCGAHDGGTFCEAWRDGADGSLAGDGAFERDGARVFGEALRIEARGDGLYYVATPEGEPSTAFRLTRATVDEVVFENPQHDFPTTITYRRSGADGLVAIVEGGARRIEFVLTRAQRAPHTTGL